MERNDKVLLMGMTFGIAVVFVFAILVSFAQSSEDPCRTKANSVAELCISTLGNVPQCRESYIRAYVACTQHNNLNDFRG